MSHDSAAAPSLSHSSREEKSLIPIKEPVADEEIGDSKLEERPDLDEALTALGLGWFHYRMLLICGWGNAVDAVEIMVLSFIMPSITDEFRMSDFDKSLLASIVFLGMLLGGLCGGLADTFGRKTCYGAALFINMLFGFLSAFSNGFPMLLCLRFLTGLGVGFSIPVMFAYFAEFLPAHRRGQWLVYLASFWMVGALVATGIAWLVLGLWGEGAWRAVVAVCAIPTGLTLLCLSSAPESPRFLTVTGQASQARTIINAIAAERGIEYRLNEDPFVPQVKHRRGVLGQLLTMWGRDYWLTSAVLTTAWVTLSYGFYGLFMWLPSYFKSQGLTGGDAFLAEFLTQLASLPGNILSSYTMDRVGRKYTFATSMTLSGLFVFCFLLASTNWQVTLAFCAFGALSVGGWNALDVLSTEMYPTSARSLAMGVLTSSGRLAAIAATLLNGLFLETNRFVPLCVTGAAMVFGGLVVLLLPKEPSMQGLEDL